MRVEVNKADTRYISDDAGNGLFATEDLDAGDVIIRVEDPYVLIPRSGVIPTLCYGCLLEKANLKCCTGCRTMSYCSKVCQTKSWRNIHKLECKIFRKCRAEGRPILPTPVRGLIQVLVRQSSGVDPDPVWSHLETHKKLFMLEKEVWQDIQLQAMAAVKYTELPMSMINIATSILCAVSLTSLTSESGRFLTSTLVQSECF